MKKTAAFLGLMVFLGGLFAAAGPVGGKKFEFGTALSFFSLKSDGDSDSWSYLNIPVRFGWFFWKGLEVEGEAILTIPIGEEYADTSYFLLGHLTYNFLASERLIPFVGGGAGVGNGLPIFGIVEGGSDINTWAFDGLAGIKFLFCDCAALRVEYRFIRYFLDAPYLLETEKGTNHQAFVGLSIFF